MSDDMRNVFRYLNEEAKRRRQNRSRRIAYWLLVAALLLATAGLVWLTYYVTTL